MSKQTKVLVVVSGGVVQEVRSTDAKLKVEVLDYDDLNEEEVSEENQDRIYKSLKKEHKHTNY